MKVFAFLAEGFEETEALMVIDLLRRTKQIEVETVSVTDNNMVMSSHGFNIQADNVIEEIDFEEGDAIFLPGGIPGTPNLEKCSKLIDGIKEYYKQDKYITAICAAPSIVSHLGMLKDKCATSHPSVKNEMECKKYGGSVVKDGKIITANGLGSALEMGLELIRIFDDEESAEKVATAIQYGK